MDVKSLDIFCEIIDNFGDIGVVYRLGKELKKSFPKAEIRIFLNRLNEFKKINSYVKDIDKQKIEDITYLTFDYLDTHNFSTASVIIEAFGCQIPKIYMERAYDSSDLLINLEYLSGEDWIEDFHLMSSPLGDTKLKKFFFMPGFTEKSGGIIADSLYLERAKKVQQDKKIYLDKYIPHIKNRDSKLIGTIFSYEKNFLPLLQDLQKLDREVVLLVMGEKSQRSFCEVLGIDFEENLKNLSKNLIGDFRNFTKCGKIEIEFMNFLTQEEYEELINAVDFNFVRGEDSFIRAVLSKKPYLWHIYCQDDLVHMDKISAFLDKYKKVIEKYSDLEFLKEIDKVFKDYNFRRKNSLELGEERYLYFFENLKKIEEMNTIFGDFLIEKCNLINKLKEFIEKY